MDSFVLLDYLELSKMLYLIGLGLGDCKDITINGLEAIQRSHKVYLEAYTSVLSVGKDQLVSSQYFLFIVLYCT